MSDDLSHYVPSRLDDPEKFLFFRKDVAAIGLTGTIGGVLLNHPAWSSRGRCDRGALAEVQLGPASRYVGSRHVLGIGSASAEEVSAVRSSRTERVIR